MHASLSAMELPPESPPSGGPPADSPREAETKRAIHELLDVLPKDVLDELNSGAIDLKLTGLTLSPVRIQVASNLSGAAWTTLATQAALSGPADYLDTGATNQASTNGAAIGSAAEPAIATNSAASTATTRLPAMVP